MTKFREESKDPMSPEKIAAHEPTAVRRNANDQEIAQDGRTGAETPEAKEKLRRSGMTKL